MLSRVVLSLFYVSVWRHKRDACGSESLQGLRRRAGIRCKPQREDLKFDLTLLSWRNCLIMCKIYNQIGCRTQIRSHLRYYGLNEHQTPEELLEFQENHKSISRQIFSNHQALIEKEKKVLEYEVRELEAAVQIAKAKIEDQLLAEIEQLKNQLNALSANNSNIFQSLFNGIKKINLKFKIRKSELHFDSKVGSSISYLVENYKIKHERKEFIYSNFEDAIGQSSLLEMQEHNRKKEVIDRIKNEIFGALGEQQVESELSNLPDEYILINDFNHRFDPPIYNRQENDHIQSIQIDHLLIAPCGIFLIETKNWSERSLNNLNFHSPVRQVKRANFALFIMLHAGTSRSSFIFRHHPWGNKKIPIRNLVVFTNHKPAEQFDFVSILALKDLRNHIQRYKPCFSDVETRAMAGHLLALNVG